MIGHRCINQIIQGHHLHLPVQPVKATNGITNMAAGTHTVTLMPNMNGVIIPRMVLGSVTCVTQMVGGTVDGIPKASGIGVIGAGQHPGIHHTTIRPGI